MTVTVLDEMPAWIDSRNAVLNQAARKCYGLRDAADPTSDRYDFCEHMGDVYLLRATCLTGEWSA